MSYDIPIEPVFLHYGGRIARQSFMGWSRAYCCLPEHDDRTASAQINTEKGRWRCLACSVNQDAIALVQHIEQLPFKEALARATEIAGSGDGNVSGGAPRRSGSLLPGLPARPRDRRDKRAYVPPWLRRG